MKCGTWIHEQQCIYSCALVLLSSTAHLFPPLLFFSISSGRGSGLTRFTGGGSTTRSIPFLIFCKSSTVQYRACSSRVSHYIYVPQTLSCFFVEKFRLFWNVQCITPWAYIPWSMILSLDGCDYNFVHIYMCICTCTYMLYMYLFTVSPLTFSQLSINWLMKAIHSGS